MLRLYLFFCIRPKQLHVAAGHLEASAVLKGEKLVCSGLMAQSEALLFWFVPSVYSGVGDEAVLNLEEVTSGCLDDVITRTCRGVFV